MGIMASQEQTVEQLFGAALDRRPENRRAFLDRVCAGAPERLEELFLADEQAGHPTASPETAGMASRASEPSSCMSPSTTTRGSPSPAMYPDQTERSSTHFLAAAVAWFDQLGIRIRRVLTDNGPCYKAHRFRRSCAQLHLKHRRTQPYTPRTNGKAERFIQTAINEWAYARTYQNSEDRTSWLPLWTHQYNWHRPHASLNQHPPISRAGLDDNNLLTHHT
jgi:transposase InsO family protein